MKDNSKSQGESQQTGTIYLLTCTVNGKQYVGQTRQKLHDRIRQHKNGTKYSAVDMAIQKYGLENFTVEVLETCPVEKLDEREIFWIRELKTRSPHGYNLTDGGNSNSNPSEETRKKISENHADFSGENNPNYGKECSPETREKIAASHRGKPSPQRGVKRSPETCKRISDAMKGKPSPRKGVKLSPETKEKMSKSKKGKGRPHTPETRRKISEANKGKPSPQRGVPRSEETKAKISEAQKAAWARRKKALENGGGK